MAESLKFDSWSADMERFLIEEVEQKKHLWDIRDPLYTKKTLKRVSYEEICRKMLSKWPQHSSFFTPDAVLKKFGNLRTYYRGQRKKYSYLKSGSGADGFASQWMHFAALSFLDRCFTAEESRCNLTLQDPVSLVQFEQNHSTGNIIPEESNIFFPEEAPSLLGMEDCDDITSTPQICTASTYSTPTTLLDSTSTTMATPSRKKRKVSSAAHDAMAEVSSYFKKLNDTESSDATKCSEIDTAFGKYIGLYISSLEDPEKKDLARIEIMKVLHKIKYDK